MHIHYNLIYSNITHKHSNATHSISVHVNFRPPLRNSQPKPCMTIHTFSMSGVTPDPSHRNLWENHDLKLSYIMIYKCYISLWNLDRLLQTPIPTSNIIFRLLGAMVMFVHETVWHISHYTTINHLIILLENIFFDGTHAKKIRYVLLIVSTKFLCF